jgi:D-alanyl-D-alanine carboxypeptidase
MLLGRVNGVDGIKTGYTDASGYNLVSSVRRDNRHLIGVVLGGTSNESRDARMRQLIEDDINFCAAGPAAAAPAVAVATAPSARADTLAMAPDAPVNAVATAPEAPDAAGFVPPLPRSRPAIVRAKISTAPKANVAVAPAPGGRAPNPPTAWPAARTAPVAAARTPRPQAQSDAAKSSATLVTRKPTAATAVVRQ